MNDPRTTPDPARTTGRTPARVISAVANLRQTPDGRRERQLIYGEQVVVLSKSDGWSYVQAEKDGYCGYVKSSRLGVVTQCNHKVSAPACHVYARPDFKSDDMMSLSFASRLNIIGQTGKFAHTDEGFIPLTHLRPLDEFASDPAEIAALFLGTPYLWGGNSRWGIDCSGLVQAALLACNIACPGDSDQQQSLGAATSGPYIRNNLLFWKGHVALVVNPDTLIHANAHAMSVTLEPIDAAIQRILTQGDGPVTGHRRL